MLIILLPFKNESNNIKNTLAEILKFCKTNIEFNYKIVFIDDHSEDTTAQIIKEENNPDILIINNRFDKGKGSALKTGFIFLESQRMNDRDLVVFMDSDGQINPFEISTLINIMRLYNADVVIGNKRHIFSNITYTLKRKIISKGYNFIIRNLFGLTIQDTQCGIKLFKYSALNKVIDKVCVKQYAFDLELIVALKENNFRICDSPVYVSKQINEGSVKLSTIISTFIDTLKIWINKKRGVYICQK